jgi:hypothetical protein
MTTDKCSFCRNHNLILSSFMMGANSAAETAYLSGSPEFTPDFICVGVA